MKLKLDAAGHAVVRDGKPIYVRGNGKEVALDAAQLEKSLHRAKVSLAIGQSKYVADNIAVPSEMLQAMFGDYFKVDADDIVPQEITGERIYSRARPGQVAEFDEALEFVVNRHVHRDSLLKPKAATPNSAHNGKIISRRQFDALSQSGRMKAVLVDKIKVVD